ncbi:hypothetical protein ABTY59_33925, partial [Streptomyces sp. NPDC096079]|uniref:hypothetical protein n=1 Tax=Streptomyces sp. NPDC096079 TaxID=3155820 RepID=UPI00331EB003
MAGLVLVVQLPPNLHELPTQGGGLGACLLGSVLCLLGELHRDGMPALGLTPCRVRLGACLLDRRPCRLCGGLRPLAGL